MNVTPSTYQAMAIKKGLEFYVRTGGRINRLYTPKNMMRTASHLTGKTFKPRDYAAAIEALGELVK